MNTGKWLILLLMALTGWWWVGRRAPTAPQPRNPVAEDRRHAESLHDLTSVLPTPAPQPAPARRVIQGPFNGLAIQVYSASDALDKYGRMIEEIADLGARCVMFSLNGYQDRIESTNIRPLPEECPPDDVWLQLFAHAHARGLKVVLMPKILLKEPNGKWRGRIQPPSWDVWFKHYSRFVLHYARLAEQGRVEMFIVGSELISSEKYTKHWRTLIRQTRAVYGGLLGYSANWDHYAGICFWGDLDVVGLTTYHQLADQPGPSLDELRQAWKPIRKKLLAWQETVGRPLLFTEAGWCSQEGCSIEPWNYYHKMEATPAGLEEQRRNYQAFVDTWADVPQVAGIIWWEWSGSDGGPEDYGYTPRGKPAEAVLRAWFQRTTGETSGPITRAPNNTTPARRPR